MTKTALSKRRRLQFAASRAVIGSSGNSPSMGGYMNTGEYLKKLDGQTGRVVFDQMRRSDPQVGAVLKAINLPLRSNEYTIEPASDDAKDKEIAERIDRRLKKEMSQTWDDTLRHALLMLPFGFSPLEKVWERADDGLIMPKKLDARLPQSIIRWAYERDGTTLIGPVQRDTNGREVILPIEKLMVFTSEREGDNWEGIPILRQAYKPWYIKDSLEKVNAIKHDRFGVGVPVGTVPDGVTPEMAQWKDMENMLERFYANEQSWIVKPASYAFDILGVSGGKEGTDALPSIKYYDEMIAKSMLAMFINLGTSDTGSRALGMSFVDAFMLSLQTFANYIAEVFTRFLLPEWVDYNWNVKDYPVMKAAQLAQIDLTQLATLFTAGALTRDLELENAIRRSMNLPEKEEDNPAPPVPVVGAPPSAPPTEPAAPPAPEAPPQAKQPPEPPAQPVKAHEHRQFSDALGPETYCDLNGMALRLNDAETVASADLLRIRDAQAKDIAIQLVAGKPVNTVRVIGKKDMYDALLVTFNAQRRAGRQDVLAEAGRQRPDIKAADKKKPTPADAAALAQERISLDVEGAGEQLKSNMAKWTIDLKQSGLQGDALRAALMDRYSAMSTASVDTVAAGAVNRGWGLGRDEGLMSIEDEVEYCYYSDIMDSALCEMCDATERLQGSDHHAVDDPEFVTPNPNCLGGGRCRCMTIGVMKTERVRAPYVPSTGFRKGVIVEPGAFVPPAH